MEEEEKGTLAAQSIGRLAVQLSQDALTLDGWPATPCSAMHTPWAVGELPFAVQSFVHLCQRPESPETGVMLPSTGVPHSSVCN